MTLELLEIHVKCLEQCLAQCFLLFSLKKGNSQAHGHSPSQGSWGLWQKHARLLPLTSSVTQSEELNQKPQKEHPGGGPLENCIMCMLTWWPWK